MKAITIQQPYATLIALPDDDDRAKRVENRSWQTDYRVPLLIHAGKGRDYLQNGDLDEFPGMPFGAVVAIANLAGCVNVSRASVNIIGIQLSGQSIPDVRHSWLAVPDWALRLWPWLQSHKHLEGPVCWVLTEVRAIEPIPWTGQRNLWDVPPELRVKVEDALGAKQK